jgi:hypothetical protein
MASISSRALAFVRSVGSRKSARVIACSANEMTLDLFVVCHRTLFHSAGISAVAPDQREANGHQGGLPIGKRGKEVQWMGLQKKKDRLTAVLQFELSRYLRRLLPTAPRKQRTSCHDQARQTGADHGAGNRGCIEPYLQLNEAVRRINETLEIDEDVVSVKRNSRRIAGEKSGGIIDNRNAGDWVYCREHVEEAVAIERSGTMFDCD